MTEGFFVSDDTLRAILLSKDGLSDIVKATGASRSTVGLIKRLRTKKAYKAAQQLRAEGLVPVIWKDGAKHRNFTPEQLHYIRTSDKTSAEVAREAGCSPSLIRMIRTGKAYAK